MRSITSKQREKLFEELDKSHDPRILFVGRRRRRERAKKVLKHLERFAMAYPDGNEDEYHGQAAAAYVQEYGSALLTMLMFQVIWYLIKTYILDDWFAKR